MHVGDQRDDLLVLQPLPAAGRREIAGDEHRLLARELRGLADCLTIRHPEHGHRIDAALNLLEVERVHGQVGIRRHDRPRIDLPRVLEVTQVPKIALEASLTCEIGADAP